MTLWNKLVHLGFKFTTFSLIIDFLSNISVYTKFNTNMSSTVKSPNCGVFQFITLMGLLFLLYTLNINHISHNRKHNMNDEENKCENTEVEAVVDDAYRVLESHKKNLWRDVR